MPAASAAATAARPWDVIVFGASGFVGRLVAAHLATSPTAAGLSIALAGRSWAGLSKMSAELVAKQRLGAKPFGIVYADITQPETIDTMAASARVIINLVGPYALYGEPVVRACAAAGTDVVDLTGETPWVASMIAKYEPDARASGAAIVSMCGFDSIPADLGVFFLADKVRRAEGVGVSAVHALIRAQAGVSGGTIASALNLMKDKNLSKAAADLSIMFPRAALESSTGGGVSMTDVVALAPDFALPTRERAFAAAAMPHIMAGVDSRVVRRTAGLLVAEGRQLAGNQYALPALVSAHVQPGGAHNEASRARAYGYSLTKPFEYTERLLVRNVFMAYALTGLMALATMLLRLPGVAAIARRFLPSPGEGPSAAQRAASWFHYYLIGTTEEATPRVAVARVSGGDGGYDDTAIMVSEAALLLARERAALPLSNLRGGFYTPAIAFGGRLVDVLNTQGVLFQFLGFGESAIPRDAGTLAGRIAPPSTIGAPPTVR